MCEFNNISHVNQQLYLTHLNKVGLSAADDKRYVLENGIDCVALGHYSFRDKWHFNWLSTNNIVMINNCLVICFIKSCMKYINFVDFVFINIIRRSKHFLTGEENLIWFLNNNFYANKFDFYSWQDRFILNQVYQNYNTK